MSKVFKVTHKVLPKKGIHNKPYALLRTITHYGKEYVVLADLVKPLGLQSKAIALAQKKYQAMQVKVEGVGVNIPCIVIKTVYVSGWLKACKEAGYIDPSLSSKWGGIVARVSEFLGPVKKSNPGPVYPPKSEPSKAVTPKEISLRAMEKKYLAAVKTADTMHTRLVRIAMNQDSWTIRDTAALLMVRQKDLITALTKEGLLSRESTGKLKGGNTSFAARFFVETAPSANVRVNPKMLPLLKGLVNRHSLKHTTVL